MAQVEASMVIDDQGSIQTLEMAGDKFEIVSESADEASSSILDFEGSLEKLEQGAFDLEEAIADANSNIDNIRKKLTAAGIVADETSASFEQIVSNVSFGDDFGADINRLRDGLKDGSIQAENLSNQFAELRSESGSTSSTIDKATSSLIDYEKAQESLEQGAFDMQEAIINTHDSIDDLRGKLGAVSQVADTTGASFEQLVTEVDFDNFGESIRSLRDDLESGEKSAENLTNAFEQLSQSQKEVAESSEELAGFQAEVVDKNSDAAQEIENNAQETENLSNQYFDASEASEAYADSLTVTSNRSEELEDSIRDQAQTLQIAEENMAAMKIRQQNVEESTKDLTQSTKRLNQEQQSFRSSGAHTNEILFSTGDAIQDLQFGIRGAGNNIAFMAENFVQAREKAGSFTSVLKGVFAALKGPLGIIVGLQALLALGPQIAQWFEDREEEAKDFKDALSDAADTMLQLDDEILPEGFKIESPEDALKVIDRMAVRINASKSELEGVNEEIRTLKDQGDFTEARQKELESLQGQRRELNNQIERYEEIRKTAIKLNDTLAANKKIRQDLEDLGLGLQEDGKETNDEIEKLLQKIADFEDTRLKFPNLEAFITDLESAEQALRIGMVDSIEEVNFVLQKLEEKQGAASGDRLRRINRLIGEYENLKSTLQNLGTEGDKAFRTIQGVQDALDAGELDTPARVNKALTFLENRLRNTKFESEESRKEIKKLIKALKELLGITEQVEEAPESIREAFEEIDKGRLLISTLETTFRDLGEAIGRGERVMTAFGDAAKQLLVEIANQIGDILIAKGSAMVAASIFTGGTSAGQGAALIGIGTSLKAGASALGSTIGGSGGSQQFEGEGAGFEGGGRGGFETRQHGGPVSAGGLYETHGIGDREFFVPRTNGQIMTSSQLGNATRDPSTQRVEVRTENRLEGEINGPDLFELDARLKEVEQFKDKYARQ